MPLRIALSWVFALAVLLARGPARFDVCTLVRADAAGVPVHQGTHEVQAVVGEAGARLVLRNGISLTIPAGFVKGAARSTRFAIAAQRARAEEVAPAFIPIGPTLELSALPATHAAPLVLQLVAERFQLRHGHRLVLAVEAREPCTEPRAACPGFHLLSGKKTAGECSAELDESLGGRLQLGSVPEVAP